MDNYSKIKLLIEKISNSDRKDTPILTMIVTKVDKTTCSAKIDDLELTDIRLSAPLNNTPQGVIMRPAIGSAISVVDLSAGDLRVLQAIAFSEIDGIEIYTGSETPIIKIENDQSIVLNGGKNGGMVNGNELINWMEFVVNDLNNINASLTGLNKPTIITTIKPSDKRLLNEQIKH